jgi:predicted nucleic acid-binding protein
MNGNKLLLDTNVVLSILGSEKVFSALAGKELFISFITELELFSYPALTKEEEKSITFFLSKVTILDINQSIKAKTIQLRKKYKLKLPDAIICATAASKNLALVSNDKQFKKITALPIVTLNQL